MKKALIVLVVLVVVAAGVWFWLGRKDAPAPDEADKEAPATVVAKVGPVRVVVESTGKVTPEQEVEIKCKASGEVVKLPVDVSDKVKKGQLLVQLDPENEDRSVKRARVALAASVAKVEQARLGLRISERNLTTERTRAEAALVSAEAKAKEARSKFERAKELTARSTISEQEFEEADSARAEAKSSLEDARARVEDLKTEKLAIDAKRQAVRVAEAQVESDKLNLSEAEQRLQETKVVAPIDGTVAERNVQVGQIIASGISNVGGGTSAMTLVDLSRMYVLASVDESDIGRIKPGLRARVTVDAYPDIVFPGEVSRVAAKGKEVSNVVTFEVKIEVQGRRRSLLKPGMRANVEIQAVDKDKALLVPVAAVGRRRRSRYVTVKKPDGATEEREVQVGVSDGERMEITSGLKEGEAVVVGKGGGSSRWRAGENGARQDRRRGRMQMRMMGGRRRR